MELAMFGLGKMGGNMARRLLRAGHRVTGFDRSADAMQELAASDHLTPAATVAEAVALLPAPRVIWMMLPAGSITENMLMETAALLSPGDILIDGGNSNFKDSMRRGAALAERGLHFLDVGVSGGIWGLLEGYSLMIGGDAAVAESLRPIFSALAPAPDAGWGRVGPVGAGHFTKMVHNGIEYGLMEAYAEGFELLKARSDMRLDLYQISQIWRQGSVVRSWLLDLIGNALQADPNLTDIRDWVADSGEGRWTVMEAIDAAVPAPVITLSLFQRFASRQSESYAAKLLAATRNQFGGHVVLHKGPENE